MKTSTPIHHADRTFRAFSDRTRLRILNLLRRGELCVCDIVRVLRAPQPTVSRHLAYLRKAGLVTARKQGLWMYYQLAPAKTEFHRKLIECLACCFNDVPELARDAQSLTRPACDDKTRCCD
jgi:ArsR family transcriptional regulator